MNSLDKNNWGLYVFGDFLLYVIYSQQKNFCLS